MVKLMVSIVVAIFVTDGRTFSPSLAKDPTIRWCTDQYDYNSFTYQCFPNPLGAYYMSYWWKVSDTNQVNGCLYALLGSPYELQVDSLPFQPSYWYMQSRIGFAGPMVPRFSVFEDKSCSDYWTSRGQKPSLKLLPGDSVRIEYKMTPADTSVSDTIRGEMKAYYLGVENHWNGHNPYNPLYEDVSGKVSSMRTTVTWSQGQILMSNPEPGPVILMNLRGQILSTSNRIDGSNTWIVPKGPMAPGVYRLRWSKGQAAVVVPGH